MQRTTEEESKTNAKQVYRHYAISVGILDPMTEEHPSGCECQLAKCVLMQALQREECDMLDGEEILDLT